MKKLLETFFHYLFGTFATRIVQFLFLPIYTANIAAENMGLYDTINAYVMVALPLLFQSVWDAVLRIGFEQRDRGSRTDFYSTVMPYSFLLAGVYLVLGLGLALLNVPYAGYIGAMAAMSGILTVYQSASRALENTKAYAVSNVVSASTSIAVNMVLIFVFQLGVEALLIANISSSVITILVVEAMIKMRGLIRFSSFSKDTFKEIMSYVKHFIIATTAWKLLGLSSSILIPRLLGFAENGVYSIASRFHTVLSTVTLVYNMAWQEEMIRRADDPDKEAVFNRIYDLLLRLCFGALYVVLAGTYIIYPYMVKGEYFRSLEYIPFIYLECIVSTLVLHLSSVLIMAKNTLGNLIDTVSGAAVNIILMLILSRYIGLYGIAIASLGCALWRLILCRKMIEKHLHPHIKPALLIGFTALYAGFSVALRQTNSLPAQLIITALAGVSALFINRGTIKQLLEFARSRMRDQADNSLM